MTKHYRAEQIQEIIKQWQDLDPNHWQAGGCGHFALALTQLLPCAQLAVIGRLAEPDVPMSWEGIYVDHVFTIIEGKAVDSLGVRSLQSLKADFHSAHGPSNVIEIDNNETVTWLLDKEHIGYGAGYIGDAELVYHLTRVIPDILGDKYKKLLVDLTLLI